MDKRIIKIDEAPDGQPIVKILWDKRVFYVHRLKPAGYEVLDHWLTPAVPVDRADMVRLAQEYITQHWD